MREAGRWFSPTLEIGGPTSTPFACNRYGNDTGGCCAPPPPHLRQARKCQGGPAPLEFKSEAAEQACMGLVDLVQHPPEIASGMLDYTRALECIPRAFHFYNRLGSLFCDAAECIGSCFRWQSCGEGSTRVVQTDRPTSAASSERQGVMRAGTPT